MQQHQAAAATAAAMNSSSFFGAAAATTAFPNENAAASTAAIVPSGNDERIQSALTNHAVYNPNSRQLLSIPHNSIYNFSQPPPQLYNQHHNFTQPNSLYAMDHSASKNVVKSESATPPPSPTATTSDQSSSTPNSPNETANRRKTPVKPNKDGAADGKNNNNVTILTSAKTGRETVVYSWMKKGHVGQLAMNQGKSLSNSSRFSRGLSYSLSGPSHFTLLSETFPVTLVKFRRYHVVSA